MMYGKTPFRDRAINTLKIVEPESTMSTNGENGGGPKKRKSVRGVTSRVEGKTTRRSNEPKEDFEMYIEEGGATQVRPENQIPITTRQGLRARIERIREGGATGFTYDDQGNVLTGKAERQYKKGKIKEARQEFRRNR
jgi:hypothetical protein